MEKANVIQEDYHSVVLASNNLRYTIDKTNNILARLNSMCSCPECITIPHKFSTGHQIDYLGDNFLYGEYEKIIISDGIKVSPGAFVYSNVQEVVWPTDCLTIPANCFYSSMVKAVSNIDNVVNIENNAFGGSDIEYFHWPRACSTVPELCFCDSHLKQIDGLQKVISINSYAFYSTRLEKIDLSSTDVLYIGPHSLYSIPRCNVNFPYYISQEEIDEAFEERL